MLIAGLDPSINRWRAIYDFTDPSQNKDNWRYLLPEEQDPMWYPLGKAESCISRNDSPVNLPDDGNDSDGDGSSEEIEPSTSEKESGFLHKIKVLGLGVWTVISQTVCSIQDFCLGIIFIGMQLPHKLLSYCDKEDEQEDKM